MWRLPKPTDVVTIYEATSEFEAMTIRDALEVAGIRAMIRTRFIPGYPSFPGTVVADKSGVWADILVRPEDEREARSVITEYLASLPGASAESEEPDTP